MPQEVQGLGFSPGDGHFGGRVPRAAQSITGPESGSVHISLPLLAKSPGTSHLHCILTTSSNPKLFPEATLEPQPSHGSPRSPSLYFTDYQNSNA